MRGPSLKIYVGSDRVKKFGPMSISGSLALMSSPSFQYFVNSLVSRRRACCADAASILDVRARPVVIW